MMWLNLTAVVLIMGAEVNGVLIALRRGPRTGPIRLNRPEETGEEKQL